MVPHTPCSHALDSEMDLYATLILIFSVDIDAVLTAGAIAFSQPRTRGFHAELNYSKIQNRTGCQQFGVE